MVPLVLTALGSLQTEGMAANAVARSLVIVEVCISLLVTVTGILGGAAFALAGKLQLEATGQPGAAAGSIVGADHAGACLGALLCGMLLVPVFGIAATALLLAGVKLGSVVLLTSQRQERV